MRLAGVRVTNFRSVEDSGEFDINQILCLVGKNEAGKTAVLQALAGLSPHPSTPITFDIERDYPRRHLTDYAKRHVGRDAVVVTTKWELTEDEIAEVAEQFGEGWNDSDTLTILRRYKASSPEWKLPVNVPRVLVHLIQKANFNAAEKAPLAKARNTQELRSALEGIKPRTEKQDLLLTRIDQLSEKSITGEIKQLLEPGLPRFMYFSHYDRMAGQLRLDTYNSRKRGEQGPPIDLGEQVFLDFLEYAGTSV
ncbi:MAG TPA: ATP-binding protein, partial [Candidatus Acidoferrum sp.]|nr:ATP-binding protein [Candidatus Acidoferrum sp.]